ncbi:2-aminoethanethiol (cysteamine) dioxygenase a [Cololabis saira]|uniref:2-aminoethanethiol (cysteamine) dioxygenase a n=1 Tax=Cololabis saira TaxID=129043 RepID=UPI002AD32823|nr:2-aminoethanethiol (cysteamine) dioxygenase a [Cololabis saira]
MPHNKPRPPLIQRIARHAQSTFRGLASAAGGDGEGHVAPERLGELVSLVTAVRAADLKIFPPKGAPPEGPPCTYMHICETEVFSMGVFLLRAGASIPLHDHPGMNGMLKVLYGKVKVRSFDKLESGPASSVAVPARFRPAVSAPQRGSIWRATLRSAAQFSEDSGPCMLTPARDNLHQIQALDGPAAFLDILAPPYDPDQGRDCHYYRFLRPVADGAGDDPEDDPEDDPDPPEGGEEAWLLEIPQPEDFWCGGEPYPGPAVSV